MRRRFMCSIFGMMVIEDMHAALWCRQHVFRTPCGSARVPHCLWELGFVQENALGERDEVEERL